MKIIVVANQKGGCSKSTTSVMLTRWLSKRGESVCLVDADAQKSSSIWIAAIPEIDRPAGVEIIDTADGILERLPALVKAYDRVVVDCPGSIVETVRAALLRADGVIVPIQPTGLDIRSGADSVRLIKQAQSVRDGKPRAVTFLARARKGTKMKSKTTEILGHLGFPAMSSVIHQKEAVGNLFGQKQTIFEAKGRAATDSAREFDNLFTEVFQQWSLI